MISQKFDEVILASGVVPRQLRIPGSDHPKVVSYVDAILQRKPIGNRVAIIGAGGIGFDVATSLLLKSPTINNFLSEWGIDPTNESRGGLLLNSTEEPPSRKVYLLQRKTSKHGSGLGTTTGWIHRLTLKKKKVEMIGGVEYKKIDDVGLHITENGKERVLEVDR